MAKSSSFFSGFEGRMKLSLPPTKSWWWGMSSKWEMAHLTCPLMRCCFIVILRLKKIALQDWMMPSFTIYLYVEEYYVKELRMKKKTSKTYYYPFNGKKVILPKQGLEQILFGWFNTSYNYKIECTPILPIHKMPKSFCPFLVSN